jgi:uncharacterized protein
MNILVIVIIIISLFVFCVTLTNVAPNIFMHTFNKYNKVQNSSGITADAFAILAVEYSGFRNLKVGRIKGELTDAYSYRDKVIALSESTIGNSSVSALAVVAHEYGHAMQHYSYNFLFALTTIFNKITRFFSFLVYPSLLASIIILVFFPQKESLGLLLLYIGLGLIAIALLYRLLTIPVEFGASRRGLKYLKDNRVLNNKELIMAKKVLKSAGFTYVAGFLSSILGWTNLVKRYK